MDQYFHPDKENKIYQKNEFDQFIHKAKKKEADTVKIENQFKALERNADDFGGFPGGQKGPTFFTSLQRPKKSMRIAYAKRCGCDAKQCHSTPEMAANLAQKEGFWGTRQETKLEVMPEATTKKKEGINKAEKEKRKGSMFFRG